MANFLGIIYLGCYFLGGALIVFLINTFMPIPSFIKRKLLHFVGVFSIFGFIYFIPNWIVSIITSLILGLISIPITYFLSKKEVFKNFLQEKYPGEVKFTISSVLIIITIVNLIFLGWINKSYYSILIILVWGIGDAFASIVGQLIGKHHFKNKFIEEKKTLEGYLANLIFSFITSLFILLFLGNIVWYFALIEATILSLVSATCELFSKKGSDTYTVTLSLLLFSILFAFIIQ